MVDNGFMEKYFSSLTFHPFSPSLSSMFEFICCLLMTSSPWTLCREKYNIHAGTLGRTVPQIILVMTWNVTRLQKLRPSSENWLSFLSTSQQDCSWIISHTSSVSPMQGVSPEGQLWQDNCSLPAWCSGRSWHRRLPDLHIFLCRLSI